MFASLLSTASSVLVITIALFFALRTHIKRFIVGRSCTFKTPMHGKIVIVTGGNTGIGFETARCLYDLGALVVLACRDEKRGQAAARAIARSGDSERVVYRHCDLSDLAIVKAFAVAFTAEFRALDVLVNNAGLMAPEACSATRQGLELQVGTNYIGHAYLTDLLLPVMRDAARVINVSSIAYMYLPTFYFETRLNVDHFWADRCTPYRAHRQYAYSKLAQILYAQHLQQKVLGDGNRNRRIKVVSLHPGVIATEISRHMLQQHKFFRLIVKYLNTAYYFLLKTPLQGAQTTLHCALIDFDALQGGECYSDCAVMDRLHFARDPVHAEYVYTETRRILQDVTKGL